MGDPNHQDGFPLTDCPCCGARCRGGINSQQDGIEIVCKGCGAIIKIPATVQRMPKKLPKDMVGTRNNLSVDPEKRKAPSA